MNDFQYNKLLYSLSKANEKRKELLEKAEDEFNRRYGNYPSDIDFEYWIDTYHYGFGFAPISEVDKQMKGFQEND